MKKIFSATCYYKRSTALSAPRVFEKWSSSGMVTPSSDVKKIAVLRANAVGDFIVSLPALEALRNRYPRAEIVFLGRHWHAAFLQGRPGPVDRTVVVPYSEGIYDPPDSKQIDHHELEKFFDEMSGERFDLAFQLHGGGKNSNGFVRSLRAGFTVGARTPDAPPLDRCVPYRPYQNETLRLLEIVEMAGAKPVNLQPAISITAEDINQAERIVPEDGRPVVVISPGSRDRRRRWPAEKFAAVADVLSGRGARIIVNGDAGDVSAVEEMLSRMRSEAQNVCGVLSLRGLAGLLARARVLISNDSGPVHLAAALGTPSVGIYWFGNLLTYGPVYFRRSSLHISWRLHCPRCAAHCIEPGCLHQDSFVSDIRAEDVTESAIELFEQGSIHDT